MSTASDPTSMSAPPAPVLQARGVRRSVAGGDGSVGVLRGIDLDVAPGELVAVLGASGSGKSTLLYTLGGLDRPDDGTVTLEGRTSPSCGRRTSPPSGCGGWASSSSRAPPGRAQPPGQHRAASAHGVPAGGGGARRRPAGALRPGGGRAPRAHRGLRGQLQRASLCRALVGSPAVLLADEPTDALNAAMTAEVLAAFSETHAAGTTIVLVTHDPGVAARADRVVCLQVGRVAGDLPLAGLPAAERERTLQERLARLGV